MGLRIVSAYRGLNSAQVPFSISEHLLQCGCWPRVQWYWQTSAGREISELHC